MNLLAFLPAVLKTLGGVLGISDKVKVVTDALASADGSPELRAQLQQAFLGHEAEMRRLGIEELKAVMSESLAMISSPDKFVSRARPTGLYIAYISTLALIIALITQVPIDPVAILTLMGPLFGAQGYYIYNRTREKLNGKS